MTCKDCYFFGGRSVRHPNSKIYCFYSHNTYKDIEKTCPHFKDLENAQKAT